MPMEELNEATGLPMGLAREAKYMRIIFSSCDYANDFEALVDASELFDFITKYRYNIWLKAYDTSCRETEREDMLADEGYEFDCYLYVISGEDGTHVIDWDKIEPRSARDRQDAERVLKKMAEDITNNNEITKLLIELM